MILLSNQEYEKMRAKASHHTDKGRLKLSFMGFLKVRLDHAKPKTVEATRAVVYKAIKEF